MFVFGISAVLIAGDANSDAFKSQQSFFPLQCQVSTTDGDSVKFLDGSSLKHLDVGVLSAVPLADHILCYHTIFSLRFISPCGRGLHKVNETSCVSVVYWFSPSLHLKRQNNNLKNISSQLFMQKYINKNLSYHSLFTHAIWWLQLWEVHSSTICILCTFLLLSVCDMPHLWERQTEVDDFQMASNGIKAKDGWLIKGKTNIKCLSEAQFEPLMYYHYIPVTWLSTWFPDKWLASDLWKAEGCFNNTFNWMKVLPESVKTQNGWQF